MKRTGLAQTEVWGQGGLFRHTLMPQIGWALVALIIGAGILGPVIQLEIRAFANGGAAFSRMIQMERFGIIFRTTVTLAVLSSVCAVILGLVLALCAQMLPAKVRRVGQLLPLFPLLLPAAAAITGWTFLLSPKVGYVNTLIRTLPFFRQMEQGPFDIYSLTAIVLITGLLLASFVYLFILTGLQNMGQELEAAAAVSGASPLRRLFTVTLPLLRPSIIFSGGMVFLLGLGQLTAPLLLGRTLNVDVLTTEMFHLAEVYPVDFGLGAALGFPILVVGLVGVIAQKAMLGEQRRYVVVSARSRYQARNTNWWSAAVIGLFGLVTTFLPLAALTFVSFSPFWSGTLSLDSFTTRHWTDVFNNPLLVSAIWTSMKAAVIAVLLVVVIGFVCASALLQNSTAARPIRAAIDFIVTLPLAIPASLMGFGLLFAYSGPPFRLYGTTAVLVITYVTLMIGYSTRLQFTNLVGIGSEFLEASKTCGAGSIRSLLMVTLPLMRRGVGATAALTFVLLFHEFSASLMVRSPRNQVIGSVLYDVWNGGGYPQVAVLALIMTVVTLFGVVVAVWIGGADSLRKM